MLNDVPILLAAESDHDWKLVQAGRARLLTYFGDADRAGSWLLERDVVLLGDLEVWGNETVLRSSSRIT